MSRPGSHGLAVDDVTPFERELREALAVEPSADFLPRVRQRLAREQVAGRSWWASWLVPAAATLAVAAAWLVVHHRPQPRPDNPGQEADVGSTTTATLPTVPASSARSLALTAAVGSAPRTTGPATTARRQTQPATAVDAPGSAAILVPPGGEVALRHFVDSVRGLNVGGETVLSASADDLAPDPRQHAAAWPALEGRVRHIDDVAWHQLEPVVMDN